MAWVAINKNYAANDATSVIVARTNRFNGYDEGNYVVVDDELPLPSNRGITYASFDERVKDRRGGTSVVHLPYGVSYKEAVELIKFYGQL
jgi:hypothetical protein